MSLYTVTFRGISSERLALLIAAGHTTPDKGHLSRAEPEIEILPPEYPTRSFVVAGSGTSVTISRPESMTIDQARALVRDEGAFWPDHGFGPHQPKR